MSTAESAEVNRNHDVEYEQAISYIQHMYDTRGRIFQFAVALNTGLLAVVFQFLKDDAAKLGLSVAGCLVTLAITLMARRAWRYLTALEDYTRELERRIGFALVTATQQKMPKGIDSTYYLFFVYWVFIGVWGVLCVAYLRRII